ncbi:hypothetical protein Pyn_20754 [Prunus yedoensis var. nudiflora]|uniref:Uncharacterized protein n=1 Tax=Prunus yedoensis var. nudiflora TaxID=2094558 RepID=A0A315A700_PRUYE|nr:hypothetical protein Pyn_20754 [Prunus yedoensis var. nudiflora]
MSFAGTPSVLLNVQTTSHNHSLSESLKPCGRANGGREVADAADRWLPMDLAELVSRIIVLEQLNSKPPIKANPSNALVSEFFTRTFCVVESLT